MKTRWFTIRWFEMDINGKQEDGELLVADDGETRSEDAKDRRHRDIHWTEGRRMRKARRGEGC